VIDGVDNAMQERIASLDVTWDQASGALGAAARAAIDTAGQWGPVLQAPADAQNGASYPATDLGEALAQAARVIRANVGVEVISVDHNGWDMHTDLGTLTSGDMHVMLDELANGIAAFFTDLGDLGDSVTLVTVSEFGRAVPENGQKGTEHGYGGVMLVIGGGVKGGYYVSKWPGCAPEQLLAGTSLKVTTDYRSVFYEVVKARFPNVKLSTLFPHFQAKTVGVMAAA
jgi:uncharacterized protein (DUF1501 family)